MAELFLLLNPVPLPPSFRFSGDKIRCRRVKEVAGLAGLPQGKLLVLPLPSCPRFNLLAVPSPPLPSWQALLTSCIPCRLRLPPPSLPSSSPSVGRALFGTFPAAPTSVPLTPSLMHNNFLHITNPCVHAPLLLVFSAILSVSLLRMIPGRLYLSIALSRPPLLHSSSVTPSFESPVFLELFNVCQVVKKLREEFAEADRAGKPARFVAWKLQAYLMFAILACVPDRQRTLRELEEGRTLIQDQQTGQWQIRHGPEDYKTGGSYGDRPILVLAPHLYPG